MPLFCEAYARETFSGIYAPGGCLRYRARKNVFT
jgi:hypothetical protein